jgi:CRISPR-associated exonuclease Cas4
MEEDFVPISALQHAVFCLRQAALIHIENVWLEDVATAEGRVIHEAVDLPGKEHRRGQRVERSVRLRCEQLRLYGVADLVEWRADAQGRVLPHPVEYKRGGGKAAGADAVQLCAQALCLEEAYGCELATADLYYAKTRRRRTVVLDEGLREATRRAAQAVHHLFDTRVLPKAEFGQKCQKCSLLAVCMPHASSDVARLRRYVEALYA